MKILIVSYTFPPCTNGAATVMYNICKYIPKRYYNVITAKSDVCLHSHGGHGSYDKDYVLDCNTIRLPVRTYGTLDRFKFFLLTIFWGLLLNKKNEFDCILAVYPYPSDLLAGYVLRKITRKPLVIYMHDLWSEMKKGARTYKIWKFLEIKIFSAASKILIMNKKYENHYLKRGIDNLTIFPPPIDLNQNKKTISSGIQFQKKNLRIAFTGSVHRLNESAVLAFLKAAKKVGDIEVLFATPSKKNYLKKISVGFLSKRECIKLQRNSDVLFLPLSPDALYPEEVKCAFPCKALEYLAAGKPILAVVPKGSFTEAFIKAHEVGIVVTDLSVKKIADAIEKLKDEERRKKLSQSALQTAELFDAKILSKQLCSLLNNIVLNHKSSAPRSKL